MTLCRELCKMEQVVSSSWDGRPFRHNRRYPRFTDAGLFTDKPTMVSYM